jgi:uncharacterized protein YdgA (DUF945 family)
MNLKSRERNEPLLPPRNTTAQSGVIGRSAPLPLVARISGEPLAPKDACAAVRYCLSVASTPAHISNAGQTQMSAHRATGDHRI